MSSIFAFFRRRRRRYSDIAPEEIFADSSNVSKFDMQQFEGRMEQPISRLALYSIVGIFVIIAGIFFVQAWKLQIAHGEEYRTRSEKNLLRPIPIFAGRGVISDRNGVELAWNAPAPVSDNNADPESAVPRREYATTTGLAHVLGYVQYPSKDSNGFYYREDFEGVDGVEKYFNDELRGENGSRLIEVDAQGSVLSHNIVRPPLDGEDIRLSIDSRVQSSLYRNIADIAERVGFSGGAGVIMNVETGEIIALTSYPEYSPQLMSDKDNSARIRSALTDPRLPFLDRATDGLYAPGSIVKPYMAIAALNENVIDPDTVITSSGSISIPNPYDSTKSTVFRDWKSHGPLAMRRALAVSSDVYFYVVGGGYKDQPGLGITRIADYLHRFGFGSIVPDSFVTGQAGTVPTPQWKKETFNEDWYLGNTYHTSIGQYGFTASPVQVVRAVAAIANSGKLIIPTIRTDDQVRVERTLDIPEEYFAIVREGMRMSVTEGTSQALNVPYIKMAGKSGTAELGSVKESVNSWITGFWPYDKPKYAFATVMEKGSVHNLIGAAAAMRQELDWMNLHTPEYFGKPPHD